jgi:hypothetical protein
MATLTNGGFTWDFSANGSVLDGTIDAYDGGMVLSGYIPSVPETTEDNGREIFFGAYVAGQITVTRKVYVPDIGTGFARYLEIADSNSKCNS